MKVFDFFNYDRRILLRFESKYAIKEDSSMIIWNEISFPGC